MGYAKFEVEARFTEHLTKSLSKPLVDRIEVLVGASYASREPRPFGLSGVGAGFHAQGICC